MAVTIANRSKGARIALPNAKIRVVDITGPASYTSPGGETLSASDINSLTEPGQGGIGAIVYFAGSAAATGHRVEIDLATSKAKFYNGTTEIANTTNLSAVVCRCIVVYGIVNG